MAKPHRATYIAPQRARRERHGQAGAERRIEPAMSIDRHAVEADEVRRTDQHDQLRRAAAELLVGVGGHRSRVHQPGVRRDQRDQLVERRRRGADGGKVPVDFGRERRFSGFEILNGYHKNANLFKANNRVRELEMVLSSGYRQTISLQDASGPQRINAQSGGLPATWVQLKIKSVYPGTKYKDTAITELRILTAD